MSKSDVRSLACVACTVAVLFLFGVSLPFVLAGLIVLAVAYALLGLLLQHRHRPVPRIRH